MNTRVLRTCGVRVDPRPMSAAADEVLAAADEGRALAVHLVNAYTLSLAARDASFAALLDRGGLNLPDGMPLVWLARRRGLTELTDRVYGPDLTLAVCDRGRAQGLRHYLYGASPEVVQAFAAALERRFPGIEVVGVESPPYRPLSVDERRALVERVTASSAQVVWVGLGTPKQDVFVDEFAEELGMPLVAVGAAFDFLSGHKPMAPTWMQRAGLEWLYRLLREPRRLWRRYLVGNVVFLWRCCRASQVFDYEA